MKSAVLRLWSICLVIGFGAMLIPASGYADSITFLFDGTLVHGDPHSFGGMLTAPFGPFPASTVSGSFTFDSHTTDANPGNHHIGQYNGAIEALSFSVTTPIFGGPHVFGFNSSGPLNSIVVDADHTPANQSYVVSASVQNLVPAGPIVDGDNYFARDFFLNLVKPSTEVFSSDALPLDPPDHTLFSLYNAVNNPLGQFRIVFASGHGDHTLIGNLTSLSAVPLPAATYLFGAGLVGLAGLARRKMAA